MNIPSAITAITARQSYAMFTGRPGIITTVTTADGSQGVATVTSGVSVGTNEAKFIYDGGDKWQGRGVEKVIHNIEEIIFPALKGKDATKQEEIDHIIIELDGTPNKAKLGGNATASVSAAVLKAGAASLGIPLYRHVGGVNGCTIPIPIIGLGTGGRYRDPGTTRWLKPSFEFSAFGAGSFVEALRYSNQCADEVERLLKLRYPDKYRPALRMRTLAGVIDDDREFLDIMTESIINCGYEGQIGIYFDCAADCYYEDDIDKYVGIFAPGEKTRDQMIDMYIDFVKNYPLVSFEDPLREDDYEGIAIITKETGIEVVGDDLFTTNIERLKQGIEAGAANSMVLKMTQVGTVSEAFAACRYARTHGYNVHPCGSRGDADSIGDVAVGLNTGQIRGTDNNRMAVIEEELGDSAVWLGKSAYNGWRNKESS